MKTAVVTGATSGIGLECAVRLARAGLRVVVVARGREKGDPAVQHVRARSGASAEHVTLETCEFGSLAEVRALATRLLEAHERIDVLVNNAGLVSDKRRVTVDGFEQTFAVNHLAPYLLTRLVLDRIGDTARAHGEARIVNVSSKSHYRGTMNFDDLHYERGYFIMSAYERSKVANVLFTRELARRLGPGSPVAVSAMHPGRIASDIWQRAPWFARPFLKLLPMDSAERGGARVTHAALSTDAGPASTGGYWSDEKRVAPSKLALDDDVARKLWDVSAHMVGLPTT